MKTPSFLRGLVAAALGTGLATAVLAGPATARADVLVYGADSDGFLEDVQAKLAWDGLELGELVVVDAGNAVLTAEMLEGYDAVVTWGNFVYEDSLATGDALADFVDDGGGVVVFAYGMRDSGLQGLRGRFVDQGYLATTLSPDNLDEPVLALGDTDAGHRILDGVTSFSASRRSSDLEPIEGATVIASYDNGELLVATNEPSGRTVVVNFFPISQHAYGGGWDPKTDGARLMANAVWWSMGADCGDGFVESDELCDDANADESDACVACQLAACGDGAVQVGVEECDDGNRVDDDECSNNCLMPEVGTSTGDASTGESAESGSETSATTDASTSSGPDTTTTTASGTTAAAGSTTTAGTGATSDADSASAGQDDSGGGGCRTGKSSPGPLVLLTLAGLVGLVRRR